MVQGIPFKNIPDTGRKAFTLSVMAIMEAHSGWKVPTEENTLQILIKGLQSLFSTDYKDLNAQEIDYAFKYKPIDIQSYGRPLCTDLVRQVLDRFIDKRNRAMIMARNFHNQVLSKFLYRCVCEQMELNVYPISLNRWYATSSVVSRLAGLHESIIKKAICWKKKFPEPNGLHKGFRWYWEPKCRVNKPDISTLDNQGTDDPEKDDVRTKMLNVL